MNRKEMVNAARQLAYEQIDSNSSLSDAEYEKLKELPEEKATKLLAMEYLKSAVEYNFGE